MGKIVDSPVPGDLGIVIERRNPELLEDIQAVSDYLKELPLSNVQHNHLVELLVAQTNAMEKNGFLEGFQLGVRLGKDA